MSDIEVDLRLVHAMGVLMACGFRGGGSEREMQDAIERKLEADGVWYEREPVLGPGERPDFRLEDGIFIECKVDGGSQAIARQLRRYALHDVVEGIIVASCRYRHGREIPDEIEGVPIKVCVFHGLP